eukprot:1912237-Prymnesium_polylepis.1
MGSAASERAEAQPGRDRDMETCPVQPLVGEGEVRSEAPRAAGVEAVFVGWFHLPDHAGEES